MHLSGYADGNTAASFNLAPFSSDIPQAGDTWDTFLLRARQNYYNQYRTRYSYQDAFGNSLPPADYTQIVGPDPQWRADWLCLYSKTATGGIGSSPYKVDPNLFFSGLLSFGPLLIPVGAALYSAITAGTLGTLPSLGVGAPSLTSTEVSTIYSDVGYTGVESGSGALGVGAPSLTSADVASIYGDAGYTGNVGTSVYQTASDLSTPFRSLTSDEVQALYGDQGYSGLTADQILAGSSAATTTAGAGSVLPSLQQAAGLATTAAGVYSAFSRGGAVPGKVPGVDTNLYTGAPVGSGLPLLANNNMLYAIGAALLLGFALLPKSRSDKVEKMFDKKG